VLIIGMEGFYFDTQESGLELVGCMKPTKTPHKNKNFRWTVDSMHLSSMVGIRAMWHSLYLVSFGKLCIKTIKNNSQILSFILKV
jgi:hypothetical protein